MPSPHRDSQHASSRSRRLPFPPAPRFLWPFLRAAKKNAAPLEITPPFRTELTHEGTKISKKAPFHNSPPKAQAGLVTRRSIPSWPRSRLTPRLLAAASAVTAERDARAGFQTDPTWRGLAVRMRDALARRGKPGEGRGAGGERGRRGVLVALPAGKCSFYFLIFLGWAS